MLIAFRGSADSSSSIHLQSRPFGSRFQVREAEPRSGERKMKSEQIKEITDRAAEQLLAALQAGHSEALTIYLRAIGRFHRYSLHNVLLIASQKPNASYVAGFRTWNGLGRFVRRGERGIMIFVPIVRGKAQNDDEDREQISRPVAGFRPAFVFDISQTDGKELPQIGVVAGDPSLHAERLRRFASAEGIAVEYSRQIAPARGTSFGGRVAILPGQSAAEEFSTLAHELAHELLHRGDRRGTTSKRVRETEAEATAFVICHAVGLETGSAASDYIQLWNGDVQVLTESLDYIRQAASQVLAALTDT
jgi:antirestriction protein ArdC